jgi:phosphotransferase system HPr-like phosphotransfer protein
VLWIFIALKKSIALARFEPTALGFSGKHTNHYHYTTKATAQWVPGVLSKGIKSGRGVTLTNYPPSSAEVMNELELYILSPPCTFTGVLWNCFYHDKGAT